MTLAGVGLAILAFLLFGGTCVLLAPLFAFLFGTYDAATPAARQGLALATVSGVALGAVCLVVTGAAYFCFTH